MSATTVHSTQSAGSGPIVQRTLAQTVIMHLLRLVPKCVKPFLYNFASKVSTCLGLKVHHNIYRFPFNLVLKISYGVREARDTEPAALRFLETLHGINAPRLIDYALHGNTTFLLSTWVSGDCTPDVWDDFTRDDFARLVAQLRAQFEILRAQTASYDHVICNASGGVVDDPRVPWVIQDDPRIFTSSKEFMEQVWIALDTPRNSKELLPLCQPLIDRTDVPIVFCHGDLFPKNILLPGGLEEWRKGHSTVCIIDWEYAGWMPLPWDALKAVWRWYEPDDEWLPMMKEVFPESVAEQDADWQWRTRSRVTIL